MNKTNNFIKDPVHGTMQFSAVENNWVKPFINSPQMQRLRHIKQLGMGDFIFPGAVHTRFNHSLGCCYLSGQIAHNLGLTAHEKQMVMLSCLLHDVGHGPFSHVLEDLFQHKLIKHEDWTPFFLADYNNSMFITQYNKRNPHYHLNPLKLKYIDALISHQNTCDSLLGDIVSSQLDADRLDYLLRDNHFCGVNYGNFDLHWLLNALIVINHGSKKRLGITYKGIGVAEHYLMARRLMIRNIYFLHKKIALEYLLIQFLLSVAQQLSEEPYNSLHYCGLGRFLLAVHQFNAQVIPDHAISAYKKKFLQDNYLIYKDLCDYDVFSLIRVFAIPAQSSTPHAIAQRLHHRIMPKIITIAPAKITAVSDMIQEYKMQYATVIKNWQLALIDLPQQSYLIAGDPILVLNQQGVAQKLDEVSLIINAVADKNELTAFLCIDREILAHSAIQQLLKQIAANNSIINYNLS